MHGVRKALRRAKTLIRSGRFERELDEELSFHLEMQTRWHESQGLDPRTARALALREFGGEVRFREAVLDTRGLSWAHDLTRDIRFAVRSYRRSPGFTVVALLTLTLGIGTTTAAFSIISGVLIRPLPYPEPDRIVTLSGRDSLGNPIHSVICAELLRLARADPQPRGDCAVLHRSARGHRCRRGGARGDG
jgi:hypothetical protein